MREPVLALVRSLTPFFCGCACALFSALVCSRVQPNASQMMTLNPASVSEAHLDRIPHFFCHACFRPDGPVLFTDPSEEVGVSALESERRLLWKLLLYSPLSDFAKGSQVLVTKRWASEYGQPGAKIFPADARSKWAEYDAYMRIPRARYCFYVEDRTAYAYVPNLHIAEGCDMQRGGMLPVDDERDVRGMTVEAWDWCCQRGRVLDDIDAALKWARANGRDLCRVPLTPFQRTVIDRERSLDDSQRDPYWFMYAIQLITGREEDGVATVASRGVTLFDLQARSDTVHDHQCATVMQRRIESPAFAQLLDEATAAWDRCSLLSLPPDADAQTAWLWHEHLFPPSYVALVDADGQVVPWVAKFKQRSQWERLAQHMATINALFQDKHVWQELRQSPPSELTPLQRQQLVALHTLFIQDSTTRLAMEVVAPMPVPRDDAHRETVGAGAAACASSSSSSVAAAATASFLAPVDARPNLFEQARRLVDHDIAIHGRLRAHIATKAEELVMRHVSNAVEAEHCLSALTKYAKQLLIQQQQKQQQQQQPT